jgi:thiosulfate reductase/polysulfide reductase chain A
VIEPQGDARSALWIYKQLGERLGIGDFFQYSDEEDYLRQQLAPLGTSLEEVRAKGYAELPHGAAETYRWNTPSGKIELKSSTLYAAGFVSVPTWEEPPDGQGSSPNAIWHPEQSVAAQIRR